MPTKRLFLMLWVGVFLVACGQLAPAPRAQSQPDATDTTRGGGIPTPVAIFRPIGSTTILKVSTIVPATPQAARQAPTPTASPEPTIAALRSRAALGDLWPPAPASMPPTRALIYNDLVLNATGGVESHVFWRVDVRQPQQRQQVVAFPAGVATHMPAYAQLSPDGQFIAYLYQAGDGAGLHVMRADGTDDRKLPGVFSVSSLGCTKRFVWSPDGRELAFFGDTNLPYQDEIYGYDPQTKAPPRLLTRGGWLHLLGWRNATTLLTIAIPQQPPTRQVQAMNTVSGARSVVVDLGGPPSYGCDNLSSDGKQVVLEGFIIDVDRQRAAALPLPVAPEQTTWNPDGTHMWEWFASGNNDSRIVTLGDPPTSRYLSVRPDATRSSSIHMQGASPDGQYVLVCETRPLATSPYTTTPPFIRTTLLYDMRANTWTVLGQGRTCGAVTGWLTAPFRG